MPSLRADRPIKTPTKKGAAKNAAKTPSRASLLKTLRKAAQERKIRPHQLERHESNPIIEPKENSFWEMKATFNPAAVYADKRVHLLYRAIGGDDVSVLGYASSDDGFTIKERLAEPAYLAIPRVKPVDEKPVDLTALFYSSGGGWNGGCEDPRLTMIDDTIYLTYTAFDGWGSVRIALSSINVKDFLKKNWEWKKSALISPPGEIHKNWMLFPEKINGKFALLHSISPDIKIAYLDSLDDFDESNFIHSRYDRASRTGAWDSWIRGAGPPPLKTKLGWLLFYHAMDIRDPDRYKLGAMILDEKDPTKVLYRSAVPILEPDAHYENHGFKAGVVYSCGAVIKDGELYVYYGGGDTVVCVAMANLATFLNELKNHGAPKLTPEIKPKKNARR